MVRAYIFPFLSLSLFPAGSFPRSQIFFLCRSRWVYKGNKEKPYLMADEPGAYVKFEVEVGVMGRVRITYLRSKTFGLGDVWCWLDEDKAQGVRVEGWWQLDGMCVFFLQLNLELFFIVCTTYCVFV
jgi:hypothetical protein